MQRNSKHPPLKAYIYTQSIPRTPNTTLRHTFNTPHPIHPPVTHSQTYFSIICICVCGWCMYWDLSLEDTWYLPIRRGGVVENVAVWCILYVQCVLGGWSCTGCCLCVYVGCAFVVKAHVLGVFWRILFCIYMCIGYGNACWHWVYVWGGGTLGVGVLG